MQRINQMLQWGFILGLASALGNSAAAFTNDPMVAQYYNLGGDTRLPTRVEQRTFTAEEARTNFTFFRGVEKLAVTNGVLRFMLAGEKAALGWGNYGGRQSPEAYQPMIGNMVEITLKQTGGENTWTFYTWADGRRIGKGEYQKGAQEPPVIQSGSATNLRVFLRGEPDTPRPDGFEIEIQGTNGMTIEISSVTLAKEFYEGYVRREFEIPAGKIWRAVAYVGAPKLPGKYGVAFYLNGQEAPRNGAWLYHAESIDVTGLMTPGKNCIGMYGKGLGAWGAPLYCLVTVIMESGEIIRCAMDGTWKYAPDVKAGWNKPGYDDSLWETALQGQGALLGYTQSACPDYQTQVPEYAGRLVLRNPKGRYLFYTDADDVLLEVRLPAGLGAKKPVLDYQFGQAQTNGQSRIIGEKTLEAFSEKNGSLIYSLNLGKLSAGVYTVALRLRSGKEILEVRPREPLLVTRRLPDKSALAAQFKDALDLELESEIDFTNPADPHPWVESEWPAGTGPAVAVTNPAIVRQAGLVYRQTAARRGSSFCYRLGEFKHVGDFYLMELEYPDDADRWTDVLVSSKTPKVWSNSQSGVGYESGGKFYKTNKLLKLYWIHVADPGVHSIDIVNGATGTRAAARGIKIYHIKSGLPVLATGTNRMSGIHTERCFTTSGIGINFGVGFPRLRDDEWQAAQAKRPLMERYIETMIEMLATAERYVQYLKFTGQNSHIMGCFQYNENNTPYVPASRLPDARLPNCMKSVFASVAEVNDIGVYAGLEISKFDRQGTVFNNLDVARGADTTWMVDAEGKQTEFGTISQNWMHPAYRAALRDLMNSLEWTFGHLANFRGAHLLLTPSQFPGGYFLPGFVRNGNFANPYERSFDDATFRQFEAETGVRLPIAPDDPQRFSKRALVIKNETFKAQFGQWRCAQLRQVMVEGRQALNGEGRRTDLELLAIPIIEVPKMYEIWRASGANFRDFLRNCAIDVGLFSNVPGVFLGRWTINWNGGGEQNPFLWIPKEDPAVTAAFDLPLNRYVLCRSSWDENHTVTGGYDFYALQKNNGLGELTVDSDWIMNSMRTRALPQPAGYHCREALIQALITGDPDILMLGFTDLNINVGNEDRLRPFWAVFTALPREKFLPVLDTDLRSNVAVRQLQRGDKTWFYLANPGYWPIQAKLTVRTKGALARIPGNAPVKLSKRGAESELALELEPYGVAAFCADDAALAITGIETGEIPAAERGYLEGIVARVTGLLDQPEIRIILPPPDREYMRTILTSAAAALASRQYARAWSFLKDAQFWDMWKEYLEKAAGAAASLPADWRIEKPENIIGLPTLKIARTTGSVTVDGKLEEADWAARPFSGGFVTHRKRPAFAATAVKGLYDDQNLYLAFACADREAKNLKATGKNEKDLFAVGDDVIALFVQPDETVPVYYQLAFNGQGVRFDQKVTGGERDYAFRPEWKAATQKQEGYWSAEAAIPVAALDSKRVSAAQWQLNFHRIYRDNLIDPCSWSFSGRDWHCPDRFGKMELCP